MTARDHAQTLELAGEVWPEAETFGEREPGGRRAKARASWPGVIRALRSWARDERPDVALSHNSYAQIVAARSLGIPAVTAMDFEHQPSTTSLSGSHRWCWCPRPSRPTSPGDRAQVPPSSSATPG